MQNNLPLEDVAPSMRLGSLGDRSGKGGPSPVRQAACYLGETQRSFLSSAASSIAFPVAWISWPAPSTVLQAVVPIASNSAKSVSILFI
mgnify:FL=1